MNTQLEKIDQLFLKGTVTNCDVVMYLRHIANISTGDVRSLNELKLKLENNQEVSIEEKRLLVEMLSNVMSLFRIYGKRSDGLADYIKHLEIPH